MKNKASYSNKKINLIYEKIVDGILLFGTIFGLIMFLIAFSPSVLGTKSLTGFQYIDIFSFLTLFVLNIYKKRYSIEFKTGVLIVIMCFFIFTDVFQYGLLNKNEHLIILIAFLSTLIFKIRIAQFIYLGVISVYLFCAYLIINSLVSFFNPTNIDLSYERWIQSAGMITIVSASISLFVYRFNNTLFNSLYEQEDQNKNLSYRDQFLTGITENIPRSAIILIDKDFTIKFVGGSEHSKTRFNSSLVIGSNITKLINESFQPSKNSIMDMISKALIGGTHSIIVKKDSESYLIKCVGLKNNDGYTESVLSVIENITEQIEINNKLEDTINEKNILIQEIHHRVKNNLAIISGLLQIQAYNSNSDETKDILIKSTNRILSIAKVHQMLYKTENFKDLPFKNYIEEFIKNILATMNINEDLLHIHTDIQIQNINLNHGIPLALIINELLTNSLKYAFDESKKNHINISLSQSETHIFVEYSDSGTGIENFDEKKYSSLGFTLITSLFQQLHAEYSFETSGQFKVSFEFPF